MDNRITVSVHVRGQTKIMSLCSGVLAELALRLIQLYIIFMLRFARLFLGLKTISEDFSSIFTTASGMMGSFGANKSDLRPDEMFPTNYSIAVVFNLHGDRDPTGIFDISENPDADVKNRKTQFLLFHWNLIVINYDHTNVEVRFSP